MGLHEDFIQYRDDQGLNQNASQNGKGVTSQNGTLFTMQYLICLLDSDTDNSIKWAETYRIADVFFDLQSFSGCSIRFHGSHEYESMDNSVALLAFSALHDDGVYAALMYEHGKNIRALDFDKSLDAQNNEKFYKIAKCLRFGFKPRWFWNNIEPNLFCMQGWFGRSPAMMGLLKMTSGKGWVNPFNFLSVLVGQFLGCTSNPANTDARTLSYVTWQFLKERSLFWKLAYKIWCWQLMRVYPNGMKDVYSQYFGKEHPISKWSKIY